MAPSTGYFIRRINQRIAHKSKRATISASIYLGSGPCQIAADTGADPIELLITGRLYAFNPNIGWIKAGPGTIKLNSTNSDYTGSTVIRSGVLYAGVNAGVGTSSLFGSGSLPLQIGDAGTLSSDSPGLLTDGGSWTVSRAIIVNDSASSSSTLGGASNHSPVFSGSLTLNDTNTNLVSASTGTNTVLFSGPISGPGGVTKTGSGNVTLSGLGGWQGATVVSSGTLFISGSLTNTSSISINAGATLQFARGTANTGQVNVDSGALLTGTGTLNAAVVNSGTLISSGTAGLTINGTVTNNGFMQLLGGASLPDGGGFINNGVLDLITSPQPLPPGFVNNGAVLDSTSVRVVSAGKSGSSLSLSVQSHAGHGYRLQKSTTLVGQDWTNVGASQSGNGSVLTFTDAGGATGALGFYRIVISP